MTAIFKEGIEQAISTVYKLCIRQLGIVIDSSPSMKGESAFTDAGKNNWKITLEKKKEFSKHELSDFHKEAVARLIKIPKTVAGDIGNMISSQNALERKQNRNVLSKILNNFRYLARQPSPLQGVWQAKEKIGADSNV